MARSFAEGQGRARVALVGSGTAAGSLIRQALVEFGVPGSRVALFGANASAEPVISEYDGEARLIQTPELEELIESDVVFLCEPGEVVDDLIGLAGSGPSIVDVAQSRARKDPVTLVHMDINPDAAKRDAGVLAVPHDLSTLLVDLLHPLEDAFGCSEAVAFIVRPASDFGEAGVHELRDQTVSLLNFAGTTAEVFGKQLAFNILPQLVLPEPRPESRIVEEVGALLGWDGPRLGVALAVAPVFFGHTTQVRLRTARPASPERVLEVLDEAGLRRPDGDVHVTPLDVSTEKGPTVAEVMPDGSGGFWLTAVAGEARARTAELAVRLADAVCGL